MTARVAARLCIVLHPQFPVLHMLSPLTPVLPAPFWLPLQGLVEAVGLSNYGPKQLAKIGAYLQKRGVPLAAVQVQYSLLR